MRLLWLLLAVVALPARAETVAVLEGLDKTTARISRLEVPVDHDIHFGNLDITVRACVKRPPEEPPQTAAFLDVEEARQAEKAGDPGKVEVRRIFSGWMFASSPAISALEDPIYDVTLLDCKSDDTAPPPSRSSGK